MFARLCGGLLYLVGFVLLAYNFFMTVRSGKPVDEKREVVLLERKRKKRGHDTMTFGETFKNDPVVYTLLGIFFMLLWFFLPPYGNLAALAVALTLGYMAVQKFQEGHGAWSKWYDRLLENWMPFSILTFIAVAIGGAVQIIPAVTVNAAKNVEGHVQKPYTPLELAGRDIYVSEGCYNCHSQMIRTMVKEVMRYGDYSRIGESIYDHPFQWGSKRSGPDLAREGGKRSHGWHFQHMLDPRALVDGSTMPSYPWLFEKKTDFKSLPKKIAVMQTLGVPYDPMTKNVILDKEEKQALEIAKRLREDDKVFIDHDKQIVALIAYLQKLGAYDDVEQEGEGRPGLLEPDVPDNYRGPTVSSR
jgi:cytochrome c oxidase cbb3-type subunit I/II